MPAITVRDYTPSMAAISPIREAMTGVPDYRAWMMHGGKDTRRPKRPARCPPKLLIDRTQ